MALLISAMVFANLLAGCGSSGEPVAEGTQEVVIEKDIETEASDDDFSTLQDAYATIVEEYNLIVDFYATNDDVPQDDALESLLTQAKEYMDMVGGINQDEITASDIEELAGSMIMLSQGLTQAAESLGIMAENGKTSSEGCSEELFAALQEAYGYLVEEYDMIAGEYKNNDSIPQDDEIENCLLEAKELIDRMGEVDRASISDDDAIILVETMKIVATSLNEVAEDIFN